jgi:hypothetical protein
VTAGGAHRTQEFCGGLLAGSCVHAPAPLSGDDRRSRGIQLAVIQTLRDPLVTRRTARRSGHAVRRASQIPQITAVTHIDVILGGTVNRLTSRRRQPCGTAHTSRTETSRTGRRYTREGGRPFRRTLLGHARSPA